MLLTIFFPLMTFKGYGALFFQPDVNIRPFVLDLIELLPPAKELLSLWFRLTNCFTVSELA